MSQRPRQSHPSVQSSFANMDGGCAGRPRPLQLVRGALPCQEINTTNICSRCIWSAASGMYIGLADDLLAVHKRLDIETEGRTDG
jgi:hypothetical protein